MKYFEKIALWMDDLKQAMFSAIFFVISALGRMF